MKPTFRSPAPVSPQTVNRRRFLAAASASAATFSILPTKTALGASANDKVSVGLIGCGGRGRWIADLFRKHGGYEVVAVQDYFSERAESAGGDLNVPAGRRYSGLSGYRRLLESKLDAVMIESPPYFHPQQAADAVDAGKHVYLAKPVAVDVPGCQSIEDSGRKATSRKLAFLVDFQTRAHPAYQEVARRLGVLPDEMKPVPAPPPEAVAAPEDGVSLPQEPGPGAEQALASGSDS